MGGKFGAGARSCLGPTIALMEMSKVIPQLLRRFDFELKGDWELYNHWLVSYKNLKVDFSVKKET
jgi:cytochrome P450